MIFLKSLHGFVGLDEIQKNAVMIRDTISWEIPLVNNVTMNNTGGG